MRDSLKFGFRNPRYFVDLALVIPVIMAVLQVAYGVFSWPPSKWNLRDVAVGLAILLVSALLAKEKVVTLGGALGYMFVMGMIRLPIDASRHSTPELLVGITVVVAAGAGTLIAMYLVRRRKQLYQPTTPWIDRLVIALAIVFMAVFFFQPLKTTFIYYVNGRVAP